MVTVRWSNTLWRVTRKTWSFQAHPHYQCSTPWEKLARLQCHAYTWYCSSITHYVISCYSDYLLVQNESVKGECCVARVMKYIRHPCRQVNLIREHRLSVYSPQSSLPSSLLPSIPPPSLFASLPCSHPYSSFPPFSFVAGAAQTLTVEPLPRLWIDTGTWNRPMQVLIWTSNYAFVASHMVVYVFIVLVGTSHSLFWNTISALYESQQDCGATLNAFLSTFRYFAKLHPYRITYCRYWAMPIHTWFYHKWHHFIVSAKADWKGGELPLPPKI